MYKAIATVAIVILVFSLILCFYLYEKGVVIEDDEDLKRFLEYDTQEGA